MATPPPTLWPMIMDIRGAGGSGNRHRPVPPAGRTEYLADAIFVARRPHGSVAASAQMWPRRRHRNVADAIASRGRRSGRSAGPRRPSLPGVRLPPRRTGTRFTGVLHHVDRVLDADFRAQQQSPPRGPITVELACARRRTARTPTRAAGSRQAHGRPERP